MRPSSFCAYQFLLSGANIAIGAGRDIALNAATNTQASQTQAHSSNTAIGLAPTGLTGRFTFLGNTNANQNADTANTSQSTSVLSANNGNLTIVAGTDAQYRGTAQGNLTAQGADLLAKGTITATGNAVDLQAVQDTSNSRSHQDSKSLTLGSQLTGAIGGAITSIGDMVEQAGDTQNARLQGALALKAGYDAYKLSSGAQATVEAGKATQPVDPNGGFGISLSIASSKSSQDNQQSATTSRGTNLQAKAIDIQARDTDITATGAKLQAQDITLDAAGRINLNAAKNTAALQSTNKGSSSGLGVTLGSTGTGQNGLSFQASASQTKGNASGSETTYDNTLITASNQLTIKSGGDTNLKGAQLAANTIKADIGGNLNIESLQDQSDYASKQTSSGFSVSLCIPPLCEGAPVTGSVSSAKQTIDHNYQSATGQSGIAAGQGGYDVTVKGNTDLKGGAITSQADKNANTLKTNSLTYTDLENRQTTNSSSSSTSLGYGGVGGMGGMLANNVTANVLGNLQGNASLPKDNQQSSKTQSVISPGHVTITGNDEQSKQAVATLTSRDLKTANGALKNTLTLQQAQDLAAKQKEQQENQRAAELMGAVMTNVIGDVAAKAGWADGSAQKLALHGIAGLVQAKVGGGNALAGIAGGMTQEALAPVLAGYLEANGVSRLLADGKENPDFKALMQAGVTLAGAAVGAVAGITKGAATGASVALTGVTNNFLKHQDVQKLSNKLQACGTEKTCRDQAFDEAYGTSAANDIALLNCKATNNCDALKAEYRQGYESITKMLDAGIKPADVGSILNLETNAQTIIRNSLDQINCKTQACTDKANYLVGLGKGLSKVTPAGLAAGSGVATYELTTALMNIGAVDTAVAVAKGVMGLPADLVSRLNSSDPQIRGEALVDALAIGTVATAVTAKVGQLGYASVVKKIEAKGQMPDFGKPTPGYGTVAYIDASTVANGVTTEITSTSLGNFLGKGGNKNVYAYGDGQAVAVLQAGKPLQSIADEIGMLNQLNGLGIPTVNARSVTVNGQPAMIMDQFTLGSKDVVALQNGKVRIVGDSPLLNAQSVSDLQNIRNTMVNNNVQIDDLQFLIGNDGRVVVADPLKVNINKPPSPNNLRTIDLLIQAAKKNGPF